MPMWRCPHCSAQQPETSRCWVCRRSTTCCATCRHFRRSIAGGLGFCGLDARRAALTGDEMRGCWQAGAEPVEEPTGSTVPAFLVQSPAPRGFVPLDDPAALTAVATPARVSPAPAPLAPAAREPDRWMLWPDGEAQPA